MGGSRLLCLDPAAGIGRRPGSSQPKDTGPAIAAESRWPLNPRLPPVPAGVLLCGCSQAARRALSRAFEEHSSMAASGHMRKVYRALVSGLVELDEASRSP